MWQRRRLSLTREPCYVFMHTELFHLLGEMRMTDSMVTLLLSKICGKDAEIYTNHIRITWPDYSEHPLRSVKSSLCRTSCWVKNPPERTSVAQSTSENLTWMLAWPCLLKIPPRSPFSLESTEFCSSDLPALEDMGSSFSLLGLAFQLDVLQSQSYHYYPRMFQAVSKA